MAVQGEEELQCVVEEYLHSAVKQSDSYQQLVLRGEEVRGCDKDEPGGEESWG